MRTSGSALGFSEAGIFFFFELIAQSYAACSVTITVANRTWGIWDRGFFDHMMVLDTIY